jgi:hypothetical protein
MPMRSMSVLPITDTFVRSRFVDKHELANLSFCMVEDVLACG